MFSGLIPAMITPFDEGGEVDLRATEAVVEHFVGAEAVVEIVNGKTSLLIGVGAPGTREAIELARHAEEIGADGVLVVSPFYWKVGEEALFRHFAAVSEAVEVPTLVYNLPLLTGIDLSPGL